MYFVLSFQYYWWFVSLLCILQLVSELFLVLVTDVSSVFVPSVGFLVIVFICCCFVIFFLKETFSFLLDFLDLGVVFVLIVCAVLHIYYRSNIICVHFSNIL